MILTHSERAAKASRAAKINTIIGRVFLTLAAIYMGGFIALGLFLHDWRPVIAMAALLMAASSTSLFRSAETERQTAARYTRLAKGVHRS